MSYIFKKIKKINSSSSCFHEERYRTECVANQKQVERNASKRLIEIYIATLQIAKKAKTKYTQITLESANAKTRGKIRGQLFPLTKITVRTQVFMQTIQRARQLINKPSMQDESLE